MLKKGRRNLYRNIDYVLIGLAIFTLSVSFIQDRQFFFYPPEWAPAFNDIRLDTIGLIAGLLLVLYGLFDWHDNFIIGILLGVCAGFVTVILVAEAIHAMFAGQFRMKPAIILNGYLLLNIMLVAYKRNTARKRKR